MKAEYAEISAKEYQMKKYRAEISRSWNREYIKALKAKGYKITR